MLAQDALPRLDPQQRAQVRAQLALHAQLPCTIRVETAIGVLSLRVDRGVTLPMSSRGLAHYLSGILPSRAGKVLDVGTGCGIQAIIAATSGAERVVAVDINPVAVQCARANFARLGLVRVETLQSNLFDGVPGHRFDTIVFAQPLFADEPISALPESVGMLDGGGLIDRFLTDLPRWLMGDGCAYLLAWPFASARNNPLCQADRFPALSIHQAAVVRVVDGPQIGEMSIVCVRHRT